MSRGPIGGPVASSDGTTTPGTPEEAGQWRGTTADERAAERRARLMAACFDVLARDGAPGVSVRAVVRDSGLSPRFFYESFPDRETLMLALWEQQYAEVVAHAEAAVAAAPGDFGERLRAALVATAAWFSERPARAEVMLHQTLAEPLLREHAQRRLPELVAGTMALAGDPEVLAALPGNALDIAVVAMSGAILNLFLEWTAGRLEVGPGELADAVVEVTGATMLILLARGRTPDRPGGGKRDGR